MKNKKKGIKRLVKILIIIIIVIGICWYLKDLKIKNIYIKGNTTLKDYEIIELAGIQDYPNMFSISSRKIEQKLKMNKLISSAKVKKNLFGKIIITIKEEKMLVKNELDNTIYLANLKKITDDNKVIGIPTLINDVPSAILNKFLEKLNKIDPSVLSKISEISYKPNEYDKDLFLFLMNDGNYVYITTTKLSNIDKYENVLIQLEGKKGIIYLDSGNHFEIFQ